MRIRTALKSLLVLFAAALILLAATLAWMRFAPRRVPEGQPPLATLEAGSLPAFRDAFNARSEQVRVLAMLSPT
ncbi:MAG: hypothetical protein ACREAA_07755 [Candidatus Polarisedimenticolia bacterium]